jgi:hypothetical protein
MHSLEFTDEQIEENRRHHGGSLYLSDDVAINFLVNGAVDFGVGVSVCHKTGEFGGRVLPTASDVQRIYTATDAAYITRERPFRRPASRRSSAAALMPQSLRRMVCPGHVRMRKI